MKELSLVERHVQEGAEHVARMAARIEELKGLGMTQAANEATDTAGFAEVLAADREHLRNVESS